MSTATPARAVARAPPRWTGRGARARGRGGDARGGGGRRAKRASGGLVRGRGDAHGRGGARGGGDGGGASDDERARDGDVEDRGGDDGRRGRGDEGSASGSAPRSTGTTTGASGAADGAVMKGGRSANDSGLKKHREEGVEAEGGDFQPRERLLDVDAAGGGGFRIKSPPPRRQSCRDRQRLA